MKCITFIYKCFLSNRNGNFIASVVLLFVTFFAGCRKDKASDEHPASVQVMNVMNDGVALYTNLSGKHPVNFSASMNLENKFFLRPRYTLWINTFPQAIDFYARPDTMPHNKPVYSTTLNVKAGSTYSLFIHGSKSGVAHTLVDDHFPAFSADSATYVRIANFSEGQPISVNLKGAANGSFVPNLPFSAVSEFITIPAGRSVKFFEFEIRDQLTGDLLATYSTIQVDATSQNPWFFKPNTLVFTGIRNSPSPNNQKIVWMSHLQN